MEPAPVLTATATGIEGLWRLQLKEVADGRGVVREFFRTSALEAAGLGPLRPWRQVNVTESGCGVIRGLHGEHMTKLVSVVSGRGFGAYVDARRPSPTYGMVVSFPLGPGTAVLVPPGVCNGFQSLSEVGTQYLYCFDSEWEPTMAGVAVSAFDPDLAIPWPLPVDTGDRSLVSEKDAGLPRLAELG